MASVVPHRSHTIPLETGGGASAAAACFGAAGGGGFLGVISS